jgi:hypothetical protein
MARPAHGRGRIVGIIWLITIQSNRQRLAARRQPRRRRGSRPAQLLDVGRDMHGLDRRELCDALRLEPVEEFRRCSHIGAARVRIPDLRPEGFCRKFRGSPYSGYIDRGWDRAWQGNGSGRRLLQGASIRSGSDSVGRSLVSDVPGQLPRSRAHAHRPRYRGGPHDDLPLDPGLCRGA